MIHFSFQISLGLRYMILSAFGFALMAVCVKYASQQEIPVLEIVAARAIVSLFLSYIDIRRKKLKLLGVRKGLLFARGLVGTFALFSVYYALTHMPLAEATVLQYLHPMFTAVLAVIFLKEKMKWPVLISIVFSFIGLLCIARPDFLFGVSKIQFSSLAVLAATVGAFGSAVAYVLVRKLNETEDHSVIIFYFPLIALPISIVLMGDQFVLPDLRSSFVLLLVGIFTQVGQVGLTKSMQTETASRATSLSYLQVAIAAILGWLFFNEVPDFWVWIGAGFILLGALINIFWKK